MDSGNVPPVGMALTKANTSSTIEIPASLRSEDRSPSDRNAEDRLWPPGFHTQDCEGPRASRSFRRANRHNLLIVRTRDQPGFGRRGASGSSCRKVGGARAAAFRGAGVLPGLVVLELRGACARQLRPADRWPSFHRVRRQRPSPSAVRGPVKASPCMQQWVYFLCQFPD